MENKLKIYANKADVTRNTNDIIKLKGQVFKYGYILNNEANEPYTMMVIGSELATFPGIAVPSRETNLTSDSLRALINESGLDPHDVTSIVFPNGESISSDAFNGFRNSRSGARNKDDGIYEFNYIHAPQVTSIGENAFDGVGGSAKYLTINLSNTTEEEAKSIPGLMNYTTGWRNDGGQTNIIWKSENKVWPIVVNVTPENRAGATIEVENNPVVWKGSTKITATVDEGYSLDRVIINGVEYPLVDGETIYTLPDDEDSARALMESGVTVQYTPIPVGARAFTIESDDNGGKFGSMTDGDLEKNGKEVKFVREGETLTLDYTFTPKPGYSILGVYETWTVDADPSKAGVANTIEGCNHVEYNELSLTDDNKLSKTYSYDDLEGKENFNIICEYKYDAMDGLFDINVNNSYDLIRGNDKIIPIENSLKVGGAKGMSFCKYPKYTVENGKAVSYEVKEGLWQGSTNQTDGLNGDWLSRDPNTGAITITGKHIAAHGQIFDREAFENNDFENSFIYKFGYGINPTLSLTEIKSLLNYTGLVYDDMNDIFFIGSTAKFMVFFRGATWFDSYEEFLNSLEYEYFYQDILLPVGNSPVSGLVKTLDGNFYWEFGYYSFTLGEIQGTAGNRWRNLYIGGYRRLATIKLHELDRNSTQWVLPSSYVLKDNSSGATVNFTHDGLAETSALLTVPDDNTLFANSNIIFKANEIEITTFGSVSSAQPTYNFELPDGKIAHQLNFGSAALAYQTIIDLNTKEELVICPAQQTVDGAAQTFSNASGFISKNDKHNPLVIFGTSYPTGNSTFGVFQYNNEYSRMFYLGSFSTCFSSVVLKEAGLEQITGGSYSPIYFNRKTDAVYMLIPSDLKTYGGDKAGYLSWNNYMIKDSDDPVPAAVVKIFEPSQI